MRIQAAESTQEMPTAARDLPLFFDGHSALVRVRSDGDGGWGVSTEVDGREIASDYCSNWRSVERFHTRMQHWLNTAALSGARQSTAA